MTSMNRPTSPAKSSIDAPKPQNKPLDYVSNSSETEWKMYIEVDNEERDEELSNWNGLNPAEWSGDARGLLTSVDGLSGGYIKLEDDDFAEQQVEEQSLDDTDRPDQHLDLKNPTDIRPGYPGDRPLAEIEDIISAKQQMADQALDGQADKPGLLSDLGDHFEFRFKCLRDMSDINNAILSQQQAVNLIPDGYEDKPVYLTKLGSSYQTRYEHLGDLSDIENAIHAQQKAVDLTVDGHSDRPSYLSNLAAAFQTRFERIGDLQDVDNAIIFQQKAVDLAPDEHASKPNYLTNLGIFTATRFERLGNLHDIEKAILALQLANAQTPHGHTDKPDRLSNLGNSFYLRFERLGDLRDIVNAVQAQQAAVNLTHDAKAGKPDLLSALGNSLRSRFEHINELCDIEASICSLQKAVDLAPDGHPCMAIYLTNLGNSFRLRFEHLYELEDIDSSIDSLQRAVVLTPDGHVDKLKYIINLAASFHTRFERLGELDDLEHCITATQQVVDLTPDDHADSPIRHSNLGGSFWTRHKRTGDSLDIESSIRSLQKAVDQTPEGHPSKPDRLSNLGISLWTRFGLLGDLSDIENSIHNLQKAVELASDRHPGKSKYLSNLGISLGARYEHLGDHHDIDEAIRVKQQAVDLTPEGHADKLIYLNNLGHSFESRYRHYRKYSDLNSAIGTYRLAANSHSGAPLRKFDAAITLLDISTAHGFTVLGLDASEAIFRLISQVVWLGQNVHRRLELVSGIGEKMTAAAAVAITSGNVTKALEWLEEGRSILWSQILQLRTPPDDLRQKHSDIANELERIACELETAGTAIGTANSQNQDDKFHYGSREEEAREHRKLAKTYEQLIEDVRKKDGLEDFLLPKKLDQLKAAAKDGPIIVINVHELRCDALILTQSGSINHVHLEKLSDSDVVEMCATLRSGLDAKHLRSRGQRRDKGNETDATIGRILSYLGSSVIEPILHRLMEENELSIDPASDVNDTHITWCTNGPLSFLPLHAATVLITKKLRCASIVSSYTPSLTALIPCLNTSKLNLRILAVSQPNAHGLASIPGTREEAKLIQKIVREVKWLDSEEASVSAVLDTMRAHNVVHLACHGKQDSKDPLQSAFVLSDGNLSLLDLMKTNMQNAQLAVLSACQTATGDQKRPEEAMHLAAGMLSVGFRSVLGTMWSIQDSDAPTVAEAFYSKLLEFEKDGVNDWRLMAAHALHLAVEKLRGKIGDDEYLRWVPFVHYGL